MRTIIRLTAAALLPLTVLACGGSGSDDDDGAIASLGGDATTSSTTGGSGGGGGGGGAGPTVEFQDAMLEYAECMRDEGIDFPDPEVGEGGLVIVGRRAGDDAGRPTPADREAMEAADAECQHFIEDVEGSFPEPSPEEQQEMQDRALEFSQCMRDEGIDFPDPQFGENGEVSIGFDGGAGDGGPDFDDPEFQDAQEACADVMGDGPMIGAGPAVSSEEG